MEKIVFAIPLFAALILIEFAYGFYKKRNTYTDIKDAVSSLTLGLSHVLATMAFSSIMLFVNYNIYEFRIFEFGIK